MLYLSTGCHPANEHASALEALARLGVTRAVIGPGRSRGDHWAAEVARYGAGLLIHHAAFEPVGEPYWNLAAGDEDLRKKAVDRAVETMREAAALGGGFYSVHPGYALQLTVAGDRQIVGPEQGRPKALDQLCRSLDRLAGMADGLGIDLLVENRPGARGSVALWQEPSEIHQTLDRVGAPMVGLLLDVGHLLLSCRARNWEPEPVVEELKGRVRAIEVSRNDGVRDLHQLPKEDGIEVELAKLAGGLSVPVILEARNLEAEVVRWAIELLDNVLTPIPST